MASIKYRVRSKKDLATIYVHLTDGRKTQLQVSTGYSVAPKYWNDKSGSVKKVAGYKDKLNLSNKLDELKLYILQSLNKDKGSGLDINSAWLKLVVEKYKNPLLEKKSEALIDRIRAYQHSLRAKFNPKTKKPISEGTIRNYNTTVARLEKYQDHKKEPVMVSDVDLTFFENFTSFLRKELNLSQNSVSKSITQIKTVCIDARDRGYSINQQVLSKKFYQAPEPTTFVTISFDEIEKIKKFKGTPYLENARDWLIIGCWTACRVGDLMKLSTNNILINTSGVKYISYIQEKTGKKLNVPLHKDVLKIIEKREGFPSPISDQRFNDWIKIVCRESGLTQPVQGSRQNPRTRLKESGEFEKWQLITSHCCRRSFATNHYELMTNKQIMSATGHATEKMLLNYIGKVESDNFDAFEKVWGNVEQQKMMVRKLYNS